MRPKEPFDKAWKYKNSIWLVWLFVPFGLTMYISFLYIGLKMKRKKWIIAGVIYSIITSQAFILTEFYPDDHIVSDLSIWLLIFGWIFALIHGFLARDEYLHMLSEKTYAHPVHYIHSPVTSPRTHQREKKNPTIVNINKATAKELEQLPSINSFLANKMVAVRRDIGHYRSFSHLIESIGVKQHILEDAKEFLIFSHNDEFDRQNKSVNLNHASVTEICNQLDLDESFAKQIVNIRKKLGSFHSLIHFMQETNLPPHIVANIKDRITFNATKADREHNPSRTPHSGRIVDY
ncbi:ComEA family DNA-binding protein [Pueribacillus sp. YX66]|uniref:ComEA family DNA-binding protein n=1 Tax=Pueribacillus sp. YX66 TaxID=3229242 RepID=UPI00358CE6E4